MKKLLLTIAFVLFASYADAGKFWPEPECPYTGHSTCSDNKDNDLDGTKDEAAPAAAFGTVTGGYAADLAECQLLTYASTADAEADSGNMAEKSGTYRTGQIGCAGNFTSATYFVWLRLRIASGTSEDKRVVWIDTSPFTRSFQNSESALPFPATSGISAAMAWSKIGEGLNFGGIANSSTTNPHTTIHKSIALNGNAAIYLTADAAVKFDCIFLATNADATPTCPSGGGAVAPQAGTITIDSVATTSFTPRWDFDTGSTDDGDCVLNYGTTAGSLTSTTGTFASTGGSCFTSVSGLTPGTVYFMRGTSSNVNGSTNTPQASVQTSVQTTGPIRFAVASGGSAVATCLSAGTPCTLARAMNQAVAGDTVQLANGTYTTILATVRSGTASQPITITAENRHLAIIKPVSSSQCVRILHSHIVLKRVVVDGDNSTQCDQDGVQVLGSKGPPEVFLTGVIIEDNRILETSGKAMFFGAVDGAIVRWNYIDTTGLGTYNSSAGMYLGSFDGSSSAKNMQIYANTIIDSMTEGFDIKTSSNNNDIHHNIVEFSGRNSNNGLAAVCNPTTGSCDNPNTGGVTFDGWSRVTDNIFKSWEVRSYGGCASTFNTSGNAIFERNVCHTATTGVALGGNSNGVATARSNTFCGLSSYATNGGGSTWTLVTNNGVPGSGAAASACDSEEARILAEMQQLPGNPDPQDPGDPGSGPIAYWTFDEGTGTTAADSIGSNDATLVNSAGWTTGKNSNALSLAGTNDHAKVLTTSMSATEGTVTLWVKPTSFPSGNRYIFGHTTQPAFGSRMQLYHDDTGGNLDFGFGDSHAKALGLQDMAVDTWYHLGFSWASGAYVVYVNGASVSSGSYSGLSAIATYLHIGKNGSDGPSPEGCACAIDEVKIWNRALSGVEVDAEFDIFGP